MYNANQINTPPDKIEQKSNDAQPLQTPITTASSLVAFEFYDGVVIAGDTLGSYASLAKFRNCPRVFKANDNIVIGVTGDYDNYQYIRDLIKQKVMDIECWYDGYRMKPKSMYYWLTRVVYNRRCEDPLWNNLIVGGMQDGVPFLGKVDKLGTAYEDTAICTGFEAHLAEPILRSASKCTPEIYKNEAINLVKKCLNVLSFRNGRSFPKYDVAVITEGKVEIQGPLSIEQSWSLARA